MSESNESESKFDISEATPIAEVEIKGLDEIADGIIDEAPTPSPEALERVLSDETESPTSTPGTITPPPVMGSGSAGPVDKYGDTFDPDKHQTESDGSPKLSKAGKLCLRPGNRSKSRTSKKAGTNDSKVFTPGSQAVNPATGLSPAQEQQARVTGKVAASLLVNVSMMVGGQDFAPRVVPEQNFDEMAVLESGFADYLIATGKTDLPPGVALTTVVAMYMLPRFTMKTTQTRAKAVGGKIYTWWQNRKLKKQRKAEKKSNGAQSDTGNDGKRENDTSERIEPVV